MEPDDIKKIFDVLSSHPREGCNVIALARETGIHPTRIREFLARHPDCFCNTGEALQYTINRFGRFQGRIEQMMTEIESVEKKKSQRWHLLPLWISIGSLILVSLIISSCTGTDDSTEGLSSGGSTSDMDFADRILIGGKVLTVDSDFSIVEAVAIKGDRILATGSNSEISKLSNTDTEIVDLQGRTVVPGLIDNHHHFVRATEQWYRHVRWDEVFSRSEALAMLREKANRLPDGEWVVVLGGWNYEQFSDDAGPFTITELDAVLPENPLYIQLGYSRGYANSSALRATGIDGTTEVQGPGQIVKDETGRLTGEFIGSGAFLRVAGNIPVTPVNVWDESLQLTMQDYIKSGVTTLLDVGGYTVTPGHYEAVKRAALAEKLPMRIFYTLNNTNGAGPTAEEIIESLSTNEPDSENDRFARFAYGEMTYAPMRDPTGADWSPTRLQQDNYAKIVRTAAENGWQIHEHSTRDDKISTFLSIIEEVDQKVPVRELRWTMAHCENISDRSIERAIDLGILFAIHSSAGLGMPARAERFGKDAVRRVPPISTIEEMGGIWGLGSDGTVVSGYNPFHNIGWAVSGKFRSGEKYLEETVSRESALIAHTRTNAYMLFKDNMLGSLEPGKYADLVVLDQDYMTVEEDQIFTIKPVMTMVGGEVVYSGN